MLPTFSGSDNEWWRCIGPETRSKSTNTSKHIVLPINGLSFPPKASTVDTTLNCCSFVIGRYETLIRSRRCSWYSECVCTWLSVSELWLLVQWYVGHCLRTFCQNICSFLREPLPRRNKVKPFVPICQILVSSHLHAIRESDNASHALVD